jgi:hypothetical protein
LLTTDPLKRYDNKKVLSHSWFKDSWIQKGLRPKFDYNTNVYDTLLHEVVNSNFWLIERYGEKLDRFTFVEMKQKILGYKNNFAGEDLAEEAPDADSDFWRDLILSYYNLELAYEDSLRDDEYYIERSDFQMMMDGIKLKINRDFRLNYRYQHAKVSKKIDKCQTCFNSYGFIKDEKPVNSNCNKLFYTKDLVRLAELNVAMIPMSPIPEISEIFEESPRSAERHIESKVGSLLEIDVEVRLFSRNRITSIAEGEMTPEFSNPN